MKLMNLAGIVGIILLIISLIFVGFSFISLYSKSTAEVGDISETESSLTNSIFSMILGIVSVILALFFYFGFVKMGEYAESKLLKVSSWLIISSILLFIFLMIFGVFYINAVTKEIMEGSSGGSSSFMFFLIIALMIAVFYVISNILFNVGLIKVSNRVKFSKSAGIIGIILLIMLVFLIVLSIFVFISIMSTLFEGGSSLGVAGGMMILLVVLYIGVIILGEVYLLLMSLSLLNASKNFE